MRIALFSTLYPFRGGIAQFSGALYHALAAKHDAKAYTFSRQYPDFLFPGSSQYVSPDDKVVPIESEAILDSINPLSYISAANKIKATAPNLLITNFWLPFFGPSVGTMAKLVGAKTKRIALLHNVIPHEKRMFDHSLSKYFVNQHDGFITLSDAVKNDLHLLKPGAPCLVKAHPLYDHFGQAVDKQEAIAKLALPNNKKLLLYFGYIRDYKGLDLLISAMAKLPEEYHLIIAGECYGDFDKYQQLINGAQLATRISLFNRYIPDHEVALLFSAADVVVLPYKTATQSGVTAIALHFDKPLIVTNVGGLKELVKHGETGLLVDKPEVSLLSDAIISYYDGYQHVDFAANIRAMKAELSWGRFVDAVLEFSSSL